MIDIKLPDGRTVTIDTDDPQAAIAAGRKIASQGQAKEISIGDIGRAVPRLIGGVLSFGMSERGVIDPVVRQAAKGASFGFSDEVAAGGDAAIGHLVGRGSQAPNFGQRYDENLTRERGQDKAYAEANPEIAIPAQMAGGVAGFLGAAPAAALRVPATVGAAIRQGAVVGGGAGAVSGFGEGEGGVLPRLEEAAKGGAIGAATGAAVPLAVGAVRRAITPFPSRLTPEQEALAQIAAKEGITLDVGQRTGNRLPQLYQTVAARHPLAASIEGPARQAQQRQYNQASMRRVGSDATNATEETLTGVKAKLGGTIDDITSRNAMPIEEKLIADLDQVRTQYGRLLESQQTEVVNRVIDDILARGASIPGKEYQAIRSALGSKAESVSDAAYKNALVGIKKAMDRAFARGVTDARDAARLETTRGQYRNLKQIEQAMRSGAEGAASGNIMPSRLAAVTANHPGSDLADLGKIGAVFLKDKIPTSGTAERAGMLGMLGGYGYAVDPTTAAMGAFGPPLISALMRSKTGNAYLSNQLLAGMPSAERSRLVSALAAASHRADRR